MRFCTGLELHYANSTNYITWRVWTKFSECAFSCTGYAAWSLHHMFKCKLQTRWFNVAFCSYFICVNCYDDVDCVVNYLRHEELSSSVFVDWFIRVVCCDFLKS